MDWEHWIRPLIGAGAALLAALLTALARMILKGIARPRKPAPGSESTDIISLKIVRHTETPGNRAKDQPQHPRQKRPGAGHGADRKELPPPPQAKDRTG